MENSITTGTLAGVALAAITLMLALTPWVIRFARAWRVVDEPEARKVHQEAKPRLGGLAIMVAAGASAAAGGLVLEVFGGPPSQTSGVLATVLLTLAAGAVMGLVGLADDLWDLKGTTKLLFILATGYGLWLAGLGFTPTQPVTWAWSLDLGWLSPLLTIAWVAAVITAIGFIDGLDGLAAGFASLCSGVVAMIAVAAGDLALAITSLAVLGAAVGFLRFNLYPSRTFMGDGGSMFLGAMLAALTLQSTTAAGVGVGFVLPAAALALPLLDAVLTVVRRILILRWPLFLADKGHVHHMLLERQVHHRHAVLLMLTAAAGILGGAASSLMLPSVPLKLTGLILCGAVLLGLFRVAGSPRLREIAVAWRRHRADQKRLSGMRVGVAGLELRFRQVRGFDDWWKVLVQAAIALGLESLELRSHDRDGKAKCRAWSAMAVGGEDAALPRMRTTLCVPDRRCGARIELDARVMQQADGGEPDDSAADRLAALTGLVGRFPVSSIREPEVPCSVDDRPLVDSVLRDGLRTTIRQRRSRQPVAAEKLPPAGRDHAPAGARVAIVHDFLYTYGGAERVLEELVALYPHADLFSLFDFLPDDQRAFIRNKPVTTSFLQRMPLARQKHRAYLLLMPLAAEQLDVSDYDIVISSSYVAAKGIITRPDQLHVCYCHSPVRFAWDLQHQYLRASRISGGPKSWIVRGMLQYIRQWDARTANGVDVFVSNSDFIGRRIAKSYRRPSTTIYPPVKVDDFPCSAQKEDYYVTASRMVPYKNIQLIVEAFNQMPDRRLVVVGTGPEFERIAAAAGPNVRLVGHQPQDRLIGFLQRAKAFVFAAEEDFGIVVVEAQAAGTPVIGYARGGVRETVADGETGTHFLEQTTEAIIDACDRFEAGAELSAERIGQHADGFSVAVFHQRFASLVTSAWASFQADGRVDEPVEVPPAEPAPKKSAQGRDASARPPRRSTCRPGKRCRSRGLDRLGREL